jgi:hypothetical protein
VAVDLCVVGFLVAGEVAPKKKTNDQQYNDSDNKEHAKSRIAGSKASPPEISFRSQQRSRLLGRPLGLRLIVPHYRVCIFCHDFSPSQPYLR